MEILKKAEKLKLALRSPRLALLLKGVFFGLLLNWYYARGGGVMYSIFFLAVSAILYARPSFGVAAYWRSYAVLMALLLLAPIFYPALGVLRWPAVLGGALIFYLILGLKELVFINRRSWHQLVFALLFYVAIFAHFVLNDFSFLVRSLGVALASFLLAEEFIRQNVINISPRVITVFAGIFSFLIFEGLWIAGWLPIGFINSANLVALSGFIFAELAVNFYQGRFNQAMFLLRMIVWVSLIAIIFLTSRWLL